MRKNILLTFACALVPGCGQMYQGFMKRGLSLLFWFFAVIGVAAVFHLGVICLLLPIIWLYSFFDTFNLRNLTDDQKMALGDFFIPYSGWTEEISRGRWSTGPNSGNTLGLVLIGLGALGLLSFVWNAISSVLWHVFPALAGFMGRIPPVILALGVIFLGYRILRGRQTTGAGGDNNA